MAGSRIAMTRAPPGMIEGEVCSQLWLLNRKLQRALYFGRIWARFVYIIYAGDSRAHPHCILLNPVELKRALSAQWQKHITRGGAKWGQRGSPAHEIGPACDDSQVQWSRATSFQTPPPTTVSETLKEKQPMEGQKHPHGPLPKLIW